MKFSTKNDNCPVPEYQVVFWGVRGSRPVPGNGTIKYGGNTSCVEILAGKRRLIIDAGTGICNLGYSLAANYQKQKITADIFFSHTHWDHLQGFPFFQPAWQKNNIFTLYDLKQKTGFNLKNCLEKQMTEPFFPISFEELSADFRFCYLQKDETIKLEEGIVVKTLANRYHSAASYLLRIEYGGKSCCYLVDFEHVLEFENQVHNFIEKTDLLIYDALFTDSEYQGDENNSSRRGWGHSTWQRGIEYARKAAVKKLILFHHSPDRTDKQLTEIENKAKKIYSCAAAKEGLVINL